jgi:transcriptional regulator with XRE-family HTH domain
MYGEKIRMIRELRGLSQENVATQLSIAQNTYSKIETNQSKAGSEILAKIANILDVWISFPISLQSLISI